MHIKAFRLSGYAAFLVLCGCSTNNHLDGHPSHEVSLEDSSEHGRESDSFSRVRIGGSLAPWESWEKGKDLQGHLFTNRRLLEAEELTKQGSMLEALRIYQEELGKKISYQEREAIVARTASLYLRQQKGQEALQSLGRFLADTKTSPKDVSLPLSLILGYSYGEANNYEQSLAWLDRVFQGKDSSLRRLGGQGIEEVIRQIPPERFEALAEKWRDDTQISRSFGRERARRSAPYYTYSRQSLTAENQEVVSDASSVTSSSSVPSRSASVMVLLPLSGPFASLGNATKRGIELALKDSNKGETSFSFIDTGSDTPSTMAAVRQATQSGMPTAILGPLVSEAAIPVSDFARTSGIPVLHFSKRENSPTGQGIFRLGITAAGQVHSLMEGVEQKGLSRFGLVYPDDAAGQEFASAFRREIAESGKQLLFESSYNRSNPGELLSLASQVEQFDVEAIFFPDAITNAAQFFPALNSKKIIPLGTGNWAQKIELRNSAGALNRALFVAPFWEESTRPIVPQFVAAYKAVYGQSPDLLAAQGFDGATLLISGLHQSQPLAEMLLSLGEYDGVTGRVTVHRDGEFERQFDVIQLQDGVLTSLRSPTSENGAGPQGA